MADSFKTIDLSVYKGRFKWFFSIASTVLVVCYLLVYFGIVIIKNSNYAEQIKDLFMILLIGAAVFYSFWQQKKRREMLKIPDFTNRVGTYYNIFMSRLWWHLASSSVSCFLYVLTGKRLFLIFAVLDIITMMLVYPNKHVFKRELMDEEIEFID